MKMRAAALVASLIVLPSIACAGPDAPPAIDSTSITPPAAENSSLLRQNYITSTGATVPHPGVSQGSGFTPLDRDIERLNDKIESGICKGC